MSTLTIGERREELKAMKLTKLRWLFKRTFGNKDWVDRRKRADLIQAILNFEVGYGGRLG